jgi:hypothetical protein
MIDQFLSRGSLRNDLVVVRAQNAKCLRLFQKPNFGILWVLTI